MTDSIQMRSVINKNRILNIAATALRGAAILCATGTLMQTLLSSIGFSRTQNYWHTTLLQAANVLTILICSRWADKGNIFKRCGSVLILNGLLFVGYLPVCIANDATWVSYALLLAVGIMQQITTGLCTVCEYKVPYFIYKPDDYGIIASIGGIISAIIQFGVGVLITYLESRFEYSSIMLAAFIISALFAALSGVCHLMYKSIINMDEVQHMNSTDGEKASVSFKEVFFHPVFIKLLPANLFRGFANGTTVVLAIMALDIGYSESVTTAMAPVQSAAAFIGCMLFGVVTTKISPRISAFVGSVLLSVGLPMMFFGNKTLFLAAVAIALFGRTFIDYAVPSVLIKAVPVEIAGTYNAWRMMLHNGGTLLAQVLAPYLPPWLLVAITVIFTVYSGLCFLLSKELRQVSPAIIIRA